MDDITFDDPLPTPTPADAGIAACSGHPAVTAATAVTTAAPTATVTAAITTTTSTTAATTTTATSSLDDSFPADSDILGFEDDDLPRVDLSFLPLLAINKDPEEEQAGRGGNHKYSWEGGGKKLSLDGLTGGKRERGVEEVEEGHPASDKEEGHEGEIRSPAKPARHLPPTRILLPGTIAAAATAAAASESTMPLISC